MNVVIMNKPMMVSTPSPPAAASAVEEDMNDDHIHDEDNEVKEEAASANVENEEDDEVRLAMEMALAAAKNPKLTPDQIRKLVGEKNKQLEIVDKVQQEKEQKRQRETLKKKEDEAKRWNEQKEKAFNWFSTKTAVISKTAEDIKFLAEKQYYADEIKRDKKVLETRKKMKVLRKTIKAHRLQGNREETRHVFKRQRLEKRLLQTLDKVDKTQRLLVNTNFNVHEYAKAMMRASRKWKKKGSDEELALEAQLCRNMHQMLAVEKQKAKLKKSTREIKKYLQRCKSWLTDKRAFCEMHLITLDATCQSTEALYKDTLSKQDKLIAKLKSSEEFQGVDLSDVDTSHLDLSDSQKQLGTQATLNALRGLPITDSIRLRKDDLDRNHQPHTSGAGMQAPSANPKAAPTPSVASVPQPTGGPELYVEATDDASISSRLSDPDMGPMDQNPTEMEDMGESAHFNFGADAPWMSDSNLTTDSGESDKEDNPKPKSKSRSSREKNSSEEFSTPLGLAADPTSSSPKVSPGSASATPKTMPTNPIPPLSPKSSNPGKGPGKTGTVSDGDVDGEESTLHGDDITNTTEMDLSSAKSAAARSMRMAATKSGSKVTGKKKGDETNGIPTYVKPRTSPTDADSEFNYSVSTPNQHYMSDDDEEEEEGEHDE